MYHVSKSSAENNSKICFKKGDLALYRKSLLAGHVYYTKLSLCIHVKENKPFIIFIVEQQRI